MATPRVTIPELPEQTAPVGTDLLVVQNGTTTKKMTIATLTTPPTTALNAHLANPTDAHDASAVSTTPNTAPVIGTNVQLQLSQAAAEIAAVKTTANTVTNKADKATQINTSAPLTGGGDLSASRTLNINVFTPTVRGAVPPPGTVRGAYLQDDGTWTVPEGGGEGGPVSGFNSAKFDRSWVDDAYNEATRVLGLSEAPTFSYIAGTTTSLTTPTEYKISKCGLGSQTTGWDGKDDPNFSIQWGPWQTVNGANNDLALQGTNKSGVAGYAWMPSIEFDLSATVDAIEVQLYGPNNIVQVWVNGIRCSDRIYSGANTIGGSSTKLFKIQFPFAGGRRIKFTSQKITSVRVPSGGTLSKPTDTRGRRIGVFGDSHVNGASGGEGAMGVGFTDTHAAYFIDAMHGQGVYGGVGGRAWATGSANPHTLVTAEVGAVSPTPLDLAMIYASTNDGPETQANIQSGMELGLSHLAAVPHRFVVSTPHGGVPATYGKINAAAQAAANAAGVPFIDLLDVFWGPGDWGHPTFNGGTASWFQRPDGTEHMTPTGHRAVGRMVFRAVAEILTYV